MQSYGDYVIEKKLVVKSTTELQGQATITNGGLTVTNGQNVLTINDRGDLRTPNGEIQGIGIVGQGLWLQSNSTQRTVHFLVTGGLGMAIQHTSGAGEGMLRFLKLNSSGAESGEYGRIEATGRLYWYGEINAAKSIGRSDIKYKENVIELDGAESLQFIKKTRPVWFDWKGSGLKDWGFIAQEFKKECPWQVFGEDGQMGINYQALTAPAFAAITHLSDKLDEQAAKIKGLEEQLQALLQTLTQPESQPTRQSKKKVSKQGE